jgi:hypothetical protein
MQQLFLIISKFFGLWILRDSKNPVINKDP